MAVFRSGKSWKAEVFVKGVRVGWKSGFERHREAKDWHDEQKRIYKDTAAPRQHTFEELLEHFKKWHLPSVRPGTKTRYLVDIDQRIAPFFRFMRLDRIDSQMVETFKARCSEQLAPKSVNNCLHTLRLLLNKAVRWKMLTENPYTIESLDVPAKPYPWWSEQEHIQRFLAAARESRYFAVYLLALETGMRYGEIIGLSPSDIDLEQGVIHVHRQWLEREGRFGPPKHGKERWIDFNPSSEVSSVIRDLLSKRRERDADVLLPTSSGAIPGKGNVAHKYFKAAIKRAQVPEICFHGLRHTFASWYMIRHDNVWDLAAILGHSSIKTTMRYAHHSQRARRKPLDLASITLKSLSDGKLGKVTSEKREEKEWRDGRDLNPKASIA